MKLLERPAWVRVNCDWLRSGLRKVRQILRAPTNLERHLRLVEVANNAAYLMRDHSLWNRPERYGGAEGGALLLLIIGERLREASHGILHLDSLLEVLELKFTKEADDNEVTREFLGALAEVTPAASIHDLASEVLHGNFPLPLDEFLHKEFTRHGWHFEHVPFETVTQAQAIADYPEERGGPDNLMNHIGRLVGWADAYPSWNFTVDGWEPIRFNKIPEATVFSETGHLVEIEGYPLPIGAGPAYAEVRRRCLDGETFKVRMREGGREGVIESKIHPRRRVLLHPVGYLRVDKGSISEK